MLINKWFSKPVMNSEAVLYFRKGFISYITLNRPRVLNALNREAWSGLYECLCRAERDDGVRAVIITGSGRAFCSGDDLKEVASLRTPGEVREFFMKYALPAVAKIIEIPKPVIAAVNGLAYGGGCEIVMICDIVVASDDASFALPEARVGAIPPIASTIGVHVIGKLNVSMMALTGMPLTAEEAYRIGLVNLVVPPEKLMETAEEAAKNTAMASPSSVKAVKKLLNRGVLEEVSKALEKLIAVSQSEEGKEGCRAFVEKRLPAWTKPVSKLELE